MTAMPLSPPFTSCRYLRYQCRKLHHLPYPWATVYCTRHRHEASLMPESRNDATIGHAKHPRERQGHGLQEAYLFLVRGTSPCTAAICASVASNAQRFGLCRERAPFSDRSRNGITVKLLQIENSGVHGARRATHHEHRTRAHRNPRCRKLWPQRNPHHTGCLQRARGG